MPVTQAVGWALLHSLWQAVVQRQSITALSLLMVVLLRPAVQAERQVVSP